MLGTLGKLYQKATSILTRLWELGIGDLLSNKRYVKAIIDLICVATWCYLVVMYYHTPYMAVAGVALIMVVFSRIFTINGDYIFSELVQPFITIAVYSFCSLLYWYVLEFALLAGILLLPCMTNEICQQYQSYYTELSPEV